MMINELLNEKDDLIIFKFINMADLCHGYKNCYFKTKSIIKKIYKHSLLFERIENTKITD